MNELELDHGSRINAADEDTLERSVGIEHVRDSERRFGQQAHHARRGGVSGGVCRAD